ncbi:dicarboxylate/amino acid:cation symporter [Olsenella sp. Marseille-P4559]|uniref:dicarboxylate/amino acid:cation symporter n=1 Tax=Olsenella sp. Marseille-P4559 TaxID=2364795 RepID=UPI00103134A3|nr:dicarboxylate/amino acid:cation symporter [Olsenella sp. Marseille-P4559]
MSQGRKKLTIVQRMFVAVLLGILAGVGFIALRGAIGAGSDVWKLIYQALFVDITSEAGTNGLGLFYIVSQLFMHMLQVAIIPVVLVSLALSICSLAQPERLGRIAVRMLVTFFCLYVAAATVAGIVSYLVAQSGGFTVTLPEAEVVETKLVDAYNPLSIIVNIVPSNMFTAMSDNGSVLAVCFIGIVAGICMAKMGERAKPIKDLLESLNELIQIFVNFVLGKLGPLSIFCMVTRSLAVYGTDYLRPAAVWIATTMLLCILLAFALYPAAVALVARLNPITFARKSAKIALFGAATQSSAATLPLNMETCVNELGCSRDVASFVLPTGATINMNGTTTMQIIAVTFIGTAAGIQMTPALIATAALIAITVSMGTPPIPAAGATLVSVVMLGAGLNTPLCLVGYSLVLALNYVPGMGVMPMNVVGDAATAVIVSKLEGTLDKERYDA